MKPKLLLRIASGLIIFHLIGHTFGHFNWTQVSDPIKQKVINEMTAHKFPFMGTVRSMGDYYDGYGYAVSIALTLIAIILWIVSDSLIESSKLAFKIVVTMSLCLFAWCIDEFIFFFPFAAGITLLAGIFTFVSAVQLRKKQS